MAEGFEMADDGMETSTSGSTPSVTSRARDAAASTGRDLLDRAVEQKDALKQRAANVADDQRLNAAGRVDAISRALHGAASSLRESGEPQLSNWVENAAGQVERLVGYLQGKPADGMLHDFEDLARRNPAMFLGGTYLAGMAVGRFLRASSPEPGMDVEYASDQSLGGSDGGGVGGARDRGYVASTGAPWTGVGMAPSTQQQSDDGFGGSGSLGVRGASEPGGGEPGLTDEDPRDAWHGSDGPGRTTGYGASSSSAPGGMHSHSDSIDTGELTSYTNGEDEHDRHDRGLDSNRGV